jgi:serine/threonine-protein kinase
MAAVKLLDPQDPKNRLDRYELIGEIATGGMAVVYLARIAGAGGFQRFVAIKRLHSHLAQQSEFVEMFLDEARLAAGIHNPHVVPILEVGGSAEQGYYLVMEYIEGDTLARVASRASGRVTGLQPAAAGGGRPKTAPASMPQNGPAVPRPVTVRLLLDSLAGLHAAHELTDPHGRALHIVHRDISPQNILVGVDGSARITDFGVARAAARLSTTRSDTVKGKLAYLSPEQARGEQVDRRTDIFAMGIILWELFTGRRLFRGETDHETLARVLSGNIPAPSQLVPGMHPAYDAVTLRALSRDVSRRYATCAEMADDLERAATEAAKAGAEGGVAQPRDVAAFMNTVLGQEIGAQRESVRVWLSQRNDPSLASSRPAMQRPVLASGAAPIVPPVPAPPRPAGMTSSPPPPPETFAPVVNAPHPDDGDPTVLRMVSSVSNASIAVASKGGSDSPFASRPSKPARIAAIVGVAALLAIGVVVLLKSGGQHPTTAVPQDTVSAQTSVSAAPTQAPAPTQAATASEAPSTAVSADAPSGESAADGPKGKGGKWHAPSGKTGSPATAAPAATSAAPAVTSAAPAPKPPGDDLSNPYK